MNYLEKYFNFWWTLKVNFWLLKKFPLKVWAIKDKVVKSTVKTWEIVYVNNILRILSSHKSWCELENESIYQQAHCSDDLKNGGCLHLRYSFLLKQGGLEILMVVAVLLLWSSFDKSSSSAAATHTNKCGSWSTKFLLDCLRGHLSFSTLSSFKIRLNDRQNSNGSKAICFVYFWEKINGIVTKKF